MNRRSWRVGGRAESSRSRRRCLDVVAVLRNNDISPMPLFPLGEGGRDTRGRTRSDSRRPARQQITQQVTHTRREREDWTPCDVRSFGWSRRERRRGRTGCTIRISPNDPCKFRGSFQIPDSPEWHGMPPAHCMALTSEAMPSRRACFECPLHASFTLNTTTPKKSFCSARPLGCVSIAQCRSERPTTLLLLAPEDN